jgi:hypothetical protein
MIPILSTVLTPSHRVISLNFEDIGSDDEQQRDPVRDVNSNRVTCTPPTPVAYRHIALTQSEINEIYSIAEIDLQIEIERLSQEEPTRRPVLIRLEANTLIAFQVFMQVNIVENLDISRMRFW